MKARPYQQTAVDEIKFNKVNLLCLPMRAGKSFIMALAIEQYQFKKILIIVGYRKIVEQLASYFPDHTHILSGKHFNHQAQVHLASFQTIANREIDFTEYDCIIQDEYHSRTSTTAADIVFQPNCTVLLFTGTPLDSRNRVLTKRIDKFIQPVTVKDLLDAGHLAPTRFLSNSSILGNHASELVTNKQDFDESVVRQIIQKEGLLQSIVDIVNSNHLDTSHKTLIYVNYIATANELYVLLQQHTNVFVVHSKLTNKQQTDAITAYQLAPSGILINVRALSLGFDSPSTDTLIYAFFTKIHSLCLQILWRASTINSQDSAKVATVYDMVGQLGYVNPYTDFKSYSSKLSCKEKCIKQYPTDLMQQYFCMESCKSNPILVPCIGQLSPGLLEYPFISNYQIHEGTPCMESRPVWQYTYKQTDLSIGVIRKWCKCNGCGTISSYDVTTIQERPDMVEVYQDKVPSNNIIIVFNKELNKAFVVFDNLTENMYQLGMYASSKDILITAYQYFTNQKFTIVANFKLSNLPNLTVIPSLSNAVSQVNWNGGDNNGFIKYIIRSKLSQLCEEWGIKPGFVFYNMQYITQLNEKSILTFLNKEGIDRTKIVKFFKKIQPKVS